MKLEKEVFFGEGASVVTPFVSSEAADFLGKEPKEPENVNPVFFGAADASTDVGGTSFGAGSSFLAALVVEVDAAGTIVGGTAAGVEAVGADGFPDMKAAVALLICFGFTSFHSASLIPAGFLASTEDAATEGVTGGFSAPVAVEFAPCRNREVAALIGFGLTSFHSASLIPSGFFGSAGV